MKLNGNALLVEENLKSSNHHVETINPLRDDAFDKDEDIQIELRTEKFKNIVEILGLDLTNDSITNTPNRVAKMYVNEIKYGLILSFSGIFKFICNGQVEFARVIFIPLVAAFYITLIL